MAVVVSAVVSPPMVTNTVFVAFDTETTGFNPKNDRLIEIGAVKFRGDGKVLAVTNWLVNPHRDIPFRAVKVHGITTPMLENAPDFKEIFPAFISFCNGAIPLAHNARFDVDFLKAEIKRANLDAPPLPVFDTLPLFKIWFPYAFSYSIESLSNYLGVQGETYHRAEADSFHIVNIFAVGIKRRPALPLPQLKRDLRNVRWLNEKKRNEDDPFDE